MQLKAFLLSMLGAIIFSGSYAQDKIYKASGEVIDAKIKSVGTKTVVYQRYDNQTGPEYTILKAEVEKIVYQNGSQDEFDVPVRIHRHGHRTFDKANDAEVKHKIIYQPNVLTLAPIQFTENGLGISVSYERVLDKNGIISFYLPVVATFNLSNGTYYNSVNGTTQNGHRDGMYYVMPGVKLYPTGCYGYVKYGIGPSLVLATGEKSNIYTDVNGNTVDQIRTHTYLGIVVNNSLNINPSPHVYLGLEIGLGFTYLDQIGGLNQSTNFVAQGSFKIGYRF